MRDGPSAGAVAMPSSSSRSSAGLDAGAESPPQAFRRPARSMRRPNALSQTGIPQSHQQQQLLQGDAPPPSPLDDRYQGNAQQTWEDDRAHREIARAAGASLADSDSQVFKTALMTKAFQSAARDGKAARTTPSRRGTADELADDDDGLSEGEFAAIGSECAVSGSLCGGTLLTARCLPQPCFARSRATGNSWSSLMCVAAFHLFRLDLHSLPLSSTPSPLLSSSSTHHPTRSGHSPSLMPSRVPFSARSSRRSTSTQPRSPRPFRPTTPSSTRSRPPRPRSVRRERRSWRPRSSLVANERLKSGRCTRGVGSSRR